VAADYATLIYNVDMFRQAGITRPPTTIAELDADNAKLIKYDSNGNIVRAGYFPQNPVTDEPPLVAGLPTWGLLFGGHFYNAATRRFELNSPGNVRALQWMVGYAKRYNQTKIDRFTASLSVGSDSVTDPFYTGKMAMDFSGAWQFYFLTAAAPKMHADIFPLPAAPGVHGHPWWIVATWGVAIPRNSQHPKEVWDFFQWLATNPQAGKVIADTYNNPAYQPALDSWYRESLRLAGPHNTLLHGLSVWKNLIMPNSTLSYYQTPITAFVDDQLNRAVQAAVHGQKTPRQALTDANGACQAQLNTVLHG
jgi:ABC-type glycerol-3-phosphate transport system substrate-binding protein